MICVPVMLLLEISGKWPDELRAIQAIKAEFHMKMADMLKEDGITVQIYPTFLQILWVIIQREIHFELDYILNSLHYIAMLHRKLMKFAYRIQVLFIYVFFFYNRRDMFSG